MRSLLKTRLIIVLAFFPLYNQFDCTSYERLSQRGQHTGTGDDAETEAYLIRVKLARGE